MSAVRPARRCRKCERHLAETGVLWSTQSRHQIIHSGAVLQSLQAVAAVHAMIVADDQTSNYKTVLCYSSEPAVNITHTNGLDSSLASMQTSRFPPQTETYYPETTLLDITDSILFAHGIVLPVSRGNPQFAIINIR